MIKARLKDAALIEEVDSLVEDTTNFHVWWLGQSGYLLTFYGERILLDPYLSDSLTVKYASTNKPHVRMSERVIDPDLLHDVSVVTSSHNHTDHLDALTLQPIIRNNPAVRFVIPEANRQFVCDRVQCDINFPIGLDAGTSTRISHFTFIGVPAKHNEIEKDDAGRHKFMGFIIRFGKWTLYHSGDTLWYGHMVETLKPFNIDLAFLPINGNDPARGVAGNLDAKEAADLGRAIGAKMVIPHHYDTFFFNTADPAMFASSAESVGQPYYILEPGAHFSSASIPQS